MPRKGAKMIRRFIAWLDRKTIEEQINYAGSQYAMALDSGDMRRAERLKLIISNLKKP